MTLPVSARLTPEVAREVCERTGSEAYIAGLIATLDNEYVLGLKAVNCQSGWLLTFVETYGGRIQSFKRPSSGNELEKPIAANILRTSK